MISGPSAPSRRIGSPHRFLLGGRSFENPGVRFRSSFKIPRDSRIRGGSPDREVGPDVSRIVGSVILFTWATPEGITDPISRRMNRSPLRSGFVIASSASDSPVRYVLFVMLLANESVGAVGRVS